MAESAENIAERIGKLEKSRTSASKSMNELEKNLNMNAEPFTPAQQWWPELDYSQYSMPPDYGMGFGASMWGWDPSTMAAVDPLQILSARVTDLERYKDEAAIHLRKLKERVDKLEKVQPPASKSKSKDIQAIQAPPGLIMKPPGIDIAEADTSASDSDYGTRSISGGRQSEISSSDDETVKEQDAAISTEMDKILEEGSEDDDLDNIPPPQPGTISRAASEVISFTKQLDNSVSITWLITNFRAKMVKQLGRASVSPCIDREDEINDARILISPLGSIDKMPRSRKEKAAYTKTVEQGPFCPYLQLKVPSKQTITFCFMLGKCVSEKQTHDFGSAPMSSQVKIEPQKDWLKSIVDGDLTLTLKIFM